MKPNPTERIHIQGIVQGVGFRPFVYRLAVDLGLDGWVNNASDGVHVLAQGRREQLDEFCRRLVTEKPAAALINLIERESTAEPVEPGFVIRASDAESGKHTLVSPDLAICPACLEELFDPQDRRYHYPFINCTNCGPRFTIIKALPYDRPLTAMAPFAMCPDCAEEYRDASNRRFHAQPDACFECGPHLEMYIPQTQERLFGLQRESSDAIIERSAQLLQAGAILAVKGLGGYHLACDAGNAEAVMQLRERKQRPRKPLAVMYRSLEMIQQSFAVSATAAVLLASPATPIVLLPYNPAGSSLATAICGDLAEIGVMLPATPLQYLLLEAIGKPLVMTSGNLSEEPIISDDRLAQAQLAAVADAFLMHDRAIVSRYDDSVVRILADESIQFVRRARGYAPMPLELPEAESELLPSAQEPEQEPVILALGPEQKSSFCLVDEGTAFVSQHLGDLETANAFNNYLQTIELYESLFCLTPDVLVCDYHPAYMSTQWAQSQDLPLVQVQHHHAHIAAVLAEHKLNREVIGIALDGTGYGSDGTIWGGEVLLASITGFERFAHLQTFRLPGGAQAIRHPLRAAYALLLEHDCAQHPAAQSLKQRLGPHNVELIEQMLAGDINSPWTSSAGRLFDAISALMGISDDASYEGEPAILLEAALWRGQTVAASAARTACACQSPLQPGLSTQSPGNCAVASHQATRTLAETKSVAPDSREQPLIISPRDILLTILDGIQAGVPTAELSSYFHDALMCKLVDAALAARESSSLDTVALSGGVFNNRYIATKMPQLLRAEGFQVLTHLNLPPNDGCISYGQAAVAAAQLNIAGKTARITPCV